MQLFWQFDSRLIGSMDDTAFCCSKEKGNAGNFLQWAVQLIRPSQVTQISCKKYEKIKKWDSKHSYINSTSPESRWVDYFIFFRLHNCRWSRFQSSAQRANDHVHCYTYCTVKCLSLKHHNGELLPSQWFKAKCSILHYSWIKRVCIMCCHSPADIR